MKRTVAHAHPPSVLAKIFRSLERSPALSRRPRSYRPLLEILEARLAPASPGNLP